MSFQLQLYYLVTGQKSDKKTMTPKKERETRDHSTTTWTELCHVFDPPPLRGQFLYPERGQKQTFLDPLPPHLVHVVIEWPIMGKHNKHHSENQMVFGDQNYSGRNVMGRNHRE